MKKMILKKWLICVALIFALTPLFSQNDPQSDSLLQILKTQLNSNYKKLTTAPTPAYYLAYRVEESTSVEQTSSFGYLCNNEKQRSVKLFIEIRVGNPAIDNMHPYSNEPTISTAVPLPYDFNRQLISKIIKTETEKAYAIALERHAIISAAAELPSAGNEGQLLFLTADPDEFYQPSSSFDFDNELWIEHTKFYTSDMSQFLKTASAKLNYTQKRNYFVNSENTYIVENHDYTYLDIAVEGLAPDNTLHHLTHRYFTDIPSHLPDKYTVNQKMKKMEEMLFQHMAAEKATTISCPVIFSAKVAAIMMHNTAGHAADNNDGKPLLQSFAHNNHISIISDPTGENYNGNILSGHYNFDYEGIKSEKVTIVDRGSVVGMLSGRTQQKGALRSNGHSRIFPIQSNLITTFDYPISHSSLENEMRKLLRQKKLEYGLLVVDADITCDTNNIINIYPTICYKIFADSRPNVLVRNVRIESLGKLLADNIVCGGGDMECVAVTCLKHNVATPTHSCAPEMLIDNVTCSQYAIYGDNWIYGGYPQSAATEEDELSEIFFAAAENVYGNNLEELRTQNSNAPYYSEFLMTDAHEFSVVSSCGSTITSTERDVRSVSPRFLLGSDKFNNENLFEGDHNTLHVYALPVELDGRNLVRELSKISKIEYGNVLRQWKAKNSVPDIIRNQKLHDRSLNDKKSERWQQKSSETTLGHLEERANELSARFKDAGFIESSKVEISACTGSAYFWNSEKTTYTKPVATICLHLEAVVNNKTGKAVLNEKDLYLDDYAELSKTKKTSDGRDIQLIETAIDSFIRECEEIHGGEEMEGDYYGPVLVTGMAVQQLLAAALLEGETNILSQREPVFISDYSHNLFNYNILESKKDNIVTNKNISVYCNGTGGGFYPESDADGVKMERTEVIRNGELITLMGDCTPTGSVEHSNGGRQIAITEDGFISAKGVKRVDFICEGGIRTSMSNLERNFLKTAQKKGYKHAYIIDRISDKTDDRGRRQIVHLYQVNVRNGKRTPVTGAKIPILDFNTLNNISSVSDEVLYRDVVVRKGIASERKTDGIRVKVFSTNAIIFEMLPIIR